tara:strand:- start:157 stop:621 length:465 start_codon:yes stop_codon:yes gene_type:complete
VGKAAGRAFASRGGQGIGIAQSGDLIVGAIVAVNAFGDVLNSDGSLMTGSSAPTEAARYPYVPLDEIAAWDSGEEKANTTIGCLVTNARLTKSEACRVADLAHTGIARSIDPPHTSVDGDALFLLATQEIIATPDLVTELGTQAVSLAIRNAVE